MKVFGKNGSDFGIVDIIIFIIIVLSVGYGLLNFLWILLILYFIGWEYIGFYLLLLTICPILFAVYLYKLRTKQNMEEEAERRDLYDEKEYHNQRVSIYIILGIVCFILYLWCWHMADEYQSYKYYCHGHDQGSWIGRDVEECKVMQERYGDLTEEEIISKRDIWQDSMVLSILSSISLFIGAVISFKKNKKLAEEIEKLELDNYNRGKKKAESERRRNADKAESERIWYAQEAERKEKINLAQNLWDKGGLENLKKARGIYSKYNGDNRKLEGDIAKEKEKHLDYDGAITDFERLGLHKSAGRVRRKKMDDMKTEQTIIHGDYVDDRDTTYVDDRDTIVQDSVISKSNIGAAGKSKSEEIKEIKELLDSGAIDKDDYEKMKREIVG